MAKRNVKVETVEAPEEIRTIKFILCPHCRARSRVVEHVGPGFDIRQCKNGHRFEFDSWIYNMLPVGYIFGNPVATAAIARTLPPVEKKIIHRHRKGGK